MYSGIPVWKEAPFLRLLLAFIAGIVIQFYTGNPVIIGWATFACSLIFLFIYSQLSTSRRFALYPVNGVLIHLIVFSAGTILCYTTNPFLNGSRIDKFLRDKNIYWLTISEPLLPRSSSWKAMATIDRINNGEKDLLNTGKILLYFKNTKERPAISYGSRIVITKTIQRIRNTDAMKDFDYVTYCALKNIHYQVFLQPGDFVILPPQNVNYLQNTVFMLQEWTVKHLKTYIGDANACGLALALLIGYKNDLDKEILNAYSNTGVVHVIAISGLHLGIIYVILNWLCMPLARGRTGKLLAPVAVLSGLWLFSLLAGAAPSILRSAVMFSSIVVGKMVCRKTSLFNNLAASAFLILCYNPYWLFDLGFLLSYGALTSIAIYSKAFYNIIHFGNRAADEIWKLVSVTIAAQILTVPIIVHNFHQFPILFIFTNLIAVPASTIILIGEIILCCAFVLPGLSEALGVMLTFMITTMNEIIIFFDSIPYSSLKGIELNYLQAILMYVFIGFTSAWLMMYKKRCLHAALVSAIVFFAAGL